MKFVKWSVVSCFLIFTSSICAAEEFCTLQPGWQLASHGSLSDKVWIFGSLAPNTAFKWIQINNPPNVSGKSSVALATVAMALKSTLKIYVEETCTSFTSWTGSVRHLILLAD